MTPIQLIAMDMDGTLLCGSPSRMPEENMAALHMAARAGIRLVLCSGRLPDDAALFAADAGLDMATLALNGACTMAHPLGDIIHESTMQAEDVLLLARMAHRYGAVCGIFSGNDLVTNEGDNPAMPPDIRWGTHLFRKEARCTYRKGLEGLDEIAHRGVNKMVILDETNAGNLPEMRREIARSVPGLEISSSWVGNLEINAGGCHKGTALAKYAASLGIPMEAVMAIGDNDNDVPMLQCAGYGVCMGNSTASALEAADYVTLRNDFGGVAAAIRRLALGQETPGVRRLSIIPED
ncbi:MAG: Cof-type HAD-IIB family hydrolase [Clostridia bacterium]|nr:Cof-type HAD-IIB family hydrolase [Clostridia bacterium]